MQLWITDKEINSYIKKIDNIKEKNSFKRWQKGRPVWVSTLEKETGKDPQTQLNMIHLFVFLSIASQQFHDMTWIMRYLLKQA